MSATATPSVYRFRQLDAPPAHHRDTLEAALDEAAAIREQARAEGHAEGRAAAEAEVRAQSAEALAELARARQALDELRDTHLEALERDAARLGLALAEQIVAGAISVEPERLVDVAGLALRRLAERRTVTLVVNPSELEVLGAAVQSLRAELGGIDQLSVQADRRVSRGGVLARTEDGEIDATVEAQLARAREIIAEELGGPDA
jgi:flagellar biosynthesis/type III secretory pathway protein FliH